MPAATQLKPQGCVALLPFTRVSLKSLIPKSFDFEPISLGDHIRKKRLQRGLFQREAAQQLGVYSWTVLNWEKGRTEPPITAMPAIFRFLGFDPYPPPKSLLQLLLAKRREMGWSIKKAEGFVDADPGTWANWEAGQTVLYRRHRALIARVLDSPFDALDFEMAARWNQLHQ